MTHGTTSGYKTHGCRCPACTAAAVAYQREYKRRRKDEGPVMVDARETREHIERLIASGVTANAIGRMTGIGHRHIHEIRFGAVKRLWPKTADAICAIPVGTMRGERRVPADRARQLIEAMGEAGVSQTAIGRALRYKYPGCVKFSRRTYVTRRSFDRLATIYRYCATRGLVPYSLLEEVTQ